MRRSSLENDTFATQLINITEVRAGWILWSNEIGQSDYILVNKNHKNPVLLYSTLVILPPYLEKLKCLLIF